MNKFVKILVEVVLFAVIVLLAFLTVKSIMKPVEFNKQKAYRESIAVQRLKDIRDLEVAFKSVNGRFTASVDTLKDFYNNGDMLVVMQVGSADDSLAVAHTAAVKKGLRGKPAEITAQLLQLYNNGDKNLVFSAETKVPVKDTLFTSRTDFMVDSLKFIPFSGKQPIQMETIVKTVSGVQVPLFEARIPYKALLKGLDNQLRINLDADCRDKNRYEGLQVGSITAPNNNAGNWE